MLYGLPNKIVMKSSRSKIYILCHIVGVLFGSTFIKNYNGIKLVNDMVLCKMIYW